MRKAFRKFRSRYFGKAHGGSTLPLAPQHPLVTNLPTTPVTSCPILTLPPDIVNLIISDCLGDSCTSTISSFSLTCHHFHTFCQPHIFKTITLKAPLSESCYPRPSPFTPAARYVSLIKESPHILELIHNLKIFNTGIMADHASVLKNAEANDLVFVLTREMKNLRRVEISLFLYWPAVTDAVRDAYRVVLGLPSLHDVVLSTSTIPSSIFGHLNRNIECLSFRGQVEKYVQSDEEAGSPPTFYPKRLILRGTTEGRPVSPLTHLFANPYLNLSDLQHLCFFSLGDEFQDLQTAFPSCARTLTSLNVHLVPWASLPQNLSLRSLRSLEWLVLTAHIGIILFSEANAVAIFRWIISTLASIPEDSPIVSIHLMLQVGTASLKAGEIPTGVLPWRALGDVFSVSPGPSTPGISRFRALKELRITFCCRGPCDTVAYNLDAMKDVMIGEGLEVLKEIRDEMAALSPTGLVVVRTVQCSDVFPNPSL